MKNKTVILLCLLSVAIGAVAMNYANSFDRDEMVEEYENALIEQQYRQDLADEYEYNMNEDGFYYDNYRDMVVEIYTMPTSKDKFNRDSLLGHIHGDTITIIPINL